MTFQRRRPLSNLLLLVFLFCLSLRGSAEQQANDDAQQQAYYDDNVQQANNGDYSQGDDYIKYWTDYAILPKRCIV
jgi:hypothetical protein